MTSSEQQVVEQTPKGSRRFFWLAFGIVAAVAIYTGGWFWAADKLEAETARALSEVRLRGQEADCTNAEARGYPFRLGLFCDGIAFGDPKLGFALSGTGLRSAAQIYQPTKIVGELDSLTGDFAVPGGAVHTSWQDIRFSTRLARPIPALVSAQSGPVIVTNYDGAQIAAASDSTIHFRPRSTDLDVAGELNGVLVTGLQGLPPLALAIDATVINGVTLLLSKDRALRSSSSEIRNVSITAPDSSLALSGTAAIDEEGLINADLKLDLKNPPAIVRLISTVMPEMASRLKQVERVVSLMGDNPSVPVAIVKGEIKLGFFTIGRIPRVEQ